MDESAGRRARTRADEGDDDDDEDKPKVVKRRKRVAEEEEEEAPEPIESQPSVIPRLINFAIGAALIRRSFAFDQATLQGDNGIRLGYQLALESLPARVAAERLVSDDRHRRLYEKEYGDATHNADERMFNGYPFNQSRLGFDVRFAIPAGDWVIVMPAVGYGRVGADLRAADRPCRRTARSRRRWTRASATSKRRTCRSICTSGSRFADVCAVARGRLPAGARVARGTDQITAEGAAR